MRSAEDMRREAPKGGRARAAKLSAKRRLEIAIKASRAAAAARLARNEKARSMA